MIAPRRHVDDRRRRGVLVGDEQLRAVGAHDDLFGIRAAVNRAHELLLDQIHDADAISRTIGRRQLALVHAGAGDGRAAERDVEASCRRG